MRRNAWLLLLLLAMPLAGCATPAQPPPDGGKTPPAPSKPLVAEAPWWEVGDAYVVVLERPGKPATTWRMVNFWNDTKTAHFWLGVEDRQQAMDMALFDSNPFMGRIHHEILTPHEKGMHAAMYSFPLEDGKRWQGFFFGRNWSFLAREARLETPLGSDKGFTVTGSAADGSGASISYDYSPRLRWLTKLEERDVQGEMALKATVTAFEQGAKGTYVFLRGRDFYKGPAQGSTHDETFKVGEKVDSMAFHVKARAGGPLEIQLLDPAGQIRERVTAAAGGEARVLREIRPAPEGDWKVRYVATGPIEGTVLATGLLETSGNL